MKKIILSFLLLVIGATAQTQTPSPTPTPPRVSLQLLWDAPAASEQVSAIWIYEKVNGVYNQIGQVPAPGTTFTVPNYDPTVSHTYASMFVTAVLASTAWSQGTLAQLLPRAEVTVPPIPAAPSNFKFQISFSLSGP